MATTAKKTIARKSTSKKKKTSASKTAVKSTSTGTKSIATLEKPQNTKANSMRPAKRVLTPFERLRSVHFSAVFSNIVLAVLTAIFVGTASAELLLNVQARDVFANIDSVVLGPASEVLFNVEYRHFLIVILGFSALASLLIATKLRARYEASVRSSISGFRWVLFGVSTALLVELVSFMGGVQDIMMLKVIGGLVLAASLLGWMSERENAVATNPKKVAFIGYVLAFVVALLPLLGSVIGTTVLNGERFGWHIYALTAAILLGFIATAMTMYSSIKNKTKLEYIAFEHRFLRIDQIVKFLVVLIIFSSLAK